MSIMTMNRVTDQDQVERQANLKKSHMHCIKKEGLRTRGNKREEEYVQHSKKRKWKNERRGQSGETQCFRTLEVQLQQFQIMTNIKV